MDPHDLFFSWSHWSILILWLLLAIWWSWTYCGSRYRSVNSDVSELSWSVLDPRYRSANPCVWSVGLGHVVTLDTGLLTLMYLCSWSVPPGTCCDLRYGLLTLMYLSCLDPSLIPDTGLLTLVYLCSWSVGLGHVVTLDTGLLALMYLCS